MKPAVSEKPAEPLVRLEHRFDLSALAALFVLTLRQQTRGLRLIVLCLLFALPAGLAVLIRSLAPPLPELPGKLEVVLVFYLIPHALVPLTALLYGAGMIQDEIEEQTLTYLLMRPLPRWALYVTKYLATLLWTSLLTAVATTVTYVAVYWGTDDFLGRILPGRALEASALLALSLASYVALFGCLSLFTRRSLIAGIAYVAVFEGLLANLDFVARRLTVMYYFRILSLRWIGLDVANWKIDLDTAPGTDACVWTLLCASVILTALAAVTFAGGEFRVKTPEGS
jgi:ABC-2 type transport system permease protein